MGRRWASALDQCVDVMRAATTQAIRSAALLSLKGGYRPVQPCTVPACTGCGPPCFRYPMTRVGQNHI
jgi:hypothetical protein